MLVAPFVFRAHANILQNPFNQDEKMNRITPILTNFVL